MAAGLFNVSFGSSLFELRSVYLNGVLLMHVLAHRHAHKHIPYSTAYKSSHLPTHKEA